MINTIHCITFVIVKKKGNQKSTYFKYLYFRIFHFSFLFIVTA